MTSMYTWHSPVEDGGRPVEDTRCFAVEEKVKQKHMEINIFPMGALMPSGRISNDGRKTRRVLV